MGSVRFVLYIFHPSQLIFNHVHCQDVYWYKYEASNVYMDLKSYLALSYL